MATKDVVVPFIQPAWRMDREVVLQDDFESVVAQELRSFLSRAPYSKEVPTPPGVLTFLAPRFQMCLGLMVRRYKPENANAGVTTHAMRTNLTAKNLEAEHTRAIMAVTTCLSLRGYACRTPSIVLESGSRVRQGRRITLYWTPLKHGYERICATVTLSPEDRETS